MVIRHVYRYGFLSANISSNTFICHELSPGQKQRRFGQEHDCQWFGDKGISIIISVISLSHLYH